MTLLGTIAAAGPAAGAGIFIEIIALLKAHGIGKAARKIVLWIFGYLIGEGLEKLYTKIFNQL
jgi:hypothetical protein